MRTCSDFFCRVAADPLPGLGAVRPAVNLFTILAGRSPGVQGAAATGRPLCAPCAMSDITQKK
ncbi:hypothetical protein DQE84_14550, partial [Staphylococcus warneri]